MGVYFGDLGRCETGFDRKYGIFEGKRVI